ncbi:RNA 2',3'-cyclic phosphodiesterase [Gammaproteobacteria bacterium]|nr:RNA 2',3'-cyclic phosphodiesterase [Gammaproteobacteria bacterium]
MLGGHAPLVNATILPCPMRLFIGLSPTPDSRNVIAALCRRIDRLGTFPRHLQWVNVDQLHLTLRFIGDANASQASALQSLVHDAPRPLPSSAAALSVDWFPSERKPYVLALQLRLEQSMAQLYQYLEQGVVELGHRPEPRVLRPHISLARPRRGSQPSGERIDFLSDETLLEPIEFSGLYLYRSDQGLYLAQ